MIAATKDFVIIVEKAPELGSYLKPVETAGKMKVSILYDS